MSTATIPPAAPVLRRLEVWRGGALVCTIDVLNEVVDSAPDDVGYLRTLPLAEALARLDALGFSTRPWAPPALRGLGAGGLPTPAGRWP